MVTQTPLLEGGAGETGRQQREEIGGKQPVLIDFIELYTRAHSTREREEARLFASSYYHPSTVCVCVCVCV